MQLSNRIAFNCSIVALGQALSMYNFNKPPRQALVSVVVPIILGLAAYLTGRIARQNTIPISVGLAVAGSPMLEPVSFLVFPQSLGTHSFKSQ